jgi:hypothetical protein
MSFDEDIREPNAAPRFGALEEGFDPRKRVAPRGFPSSLSVGRGFFVFLLIVLDKGEFLWN